MIQRDRFGRKITPAAAGAPAPPNPRGERTERQKANGPHEFKVSGGNEDVTSSNMMTRLFKLLGLCLLAVVVIQVGWFVMHRADPHYTRAEKLVNDYEMARPKEARNYGHTVYRQALEELSLVDPGSVSAEAAEALRRRIEMDIEDFTRRRESEQEARSAAADQRVSTEAAVMAAGRREAVDPLVAFPECEDDPIDYRRDNDD